MKKVFTKQKILSLIYKLLIAGVIILVDLLTKSFFQNYFANPDIPAIPVIDHVISFVYVRNTGAAFGIFRDNAILLAIFSGLFLVSFILFDMFSGKKNVWYFLGVAFIIGGAIGNMVDRMVFNFVRDFIYLDFIGWFPVFNVADIFLTVGVICFLIYIVFYMFKEDKQNKDENKKLRF